MAEDATAAVASLHVYPVKSCRGIELPEARLARTGIEHDREWLVVSPAGRFVTQRELPRMALIGTALTAQQLVLSAPDMAPLALPLQRQATTASAAREVVVWDDRCAAQDQGDAAAAWFTRFLGRPLRLVRFDPAGQRLSSAKWTGGLAAPTLFSDGFALLVLSLGSLADLNARLETPLPLNRFRPNLVLRDVAPYAEDAMHELQAPGLRLRLVKPCARCIITTTDQATGEQQGAEPLRTLRGYRQDRALKGMVFGQNAIVIEAGTLRSGQQLAVRMR
jgi:uncharacterized protein YcbX